jgi:hypothetical protein
LSRPQAKNDLRAFNHNGANGEKNGENGDEDKENYPCVSRVPWLNFQLQGCVKLG